MNIEVECRRCDGKGWNPERKVLIGTRAGVYEVDCPACGGHGYIISDLEDEIEDWMRDE